MALNILVTVGSVRTDRIGIRPAQYLQQLCASRGHEATLVDPLEYRLPLLDRMYKEYPAGQAPENLERLAKLIKSSDAVIVVSGEYSDSRDFPGCRIWILTWPPSLNPILAGGSLLLNGLPNSGAQAGHMLFDLFKHLGRYFARQHIVQVRQQSLQVIGR